MEIPLPPKADESHHCTIETVHRGRVTGFYVRCEMGCEPPRLCRTMRQANRLAWEHEESRRLGFGQ